MIKVKELKNALGNITILVDTREQQNRHIIKYFDIKNIKYKKQKLDTGDYSCVAESNNKIIDFSDKITIERKATLEELSNNFTFDRERFRKEFDRYKGKVYLMIEQGSYEDIIFNRYKTRFRPNSFIGSMNSFETDYNISTNFILNKKLSGNYIYHKLYYFVRGYIKNIILK